MYQNFKQIYKQFYDFFSLATINNNSGAGAGCFRLNDPVLLVGVACCMMLLRPEVRQSSDPAIQQSEDLFKTEKAPGLAGGFQYYVDCRKLYHIYRSVI
jgi:hypothetical protein